MSQQWCAWSDVTRRSRMIRNPSRITLNFCGCVQIPSLEVMTSKLVHGNSMLIIFQVMLLAAPTILSRVLVVGQLHRASQLLRHRAQPRSLSLDLDNPRRRTNTHMFFDHRLARIQTRYNTLAPRE